MSSTSSSSANRVLVYLYWLVALGTFAGGLAMLYWYTPTISVDQAGAQKIFYIHLPVAINAFLACFMVFIAGVGYLMQRKMWWDDLACASGKVAVLMCSIVLLTGMIWGRSAWNTWWSWTPRLTFSLVLWLLFVVYLMIRPSIESPQRRAIVSAVYGIIAFLDVPLVYLSTTLMPDDLHPQKVELGAVEMKYTLLYWFLPITLITAGLIIARFKMNRRERVLADLIIDDEDGDEGTSKVHVVGV